MKPLSQYGTAALSVLFPCSNPSPLGSGRFGSVLKVTWNSPAGSVEVAVKKLNDGALQEERVKFLQEAAIMKQFNHPNVVEIKGVVIDCLTASQNKDAVSTSALVCPKALLCLVLFPSFCSSHLPPSSFPFIPHPLCITTTTMLSWWWCLLRIQCMVRTYM